MDPVEEIKDRLSVDEVVGGYVQLNQAGRNFKGLCPFHEEKTPSFMVSTEKGIYHCFGCNEGGDIFSFVEKMEGLDFRGALELLAPKAGVELPQYEGGGEEKKQHKQRLREALSTAAQYYHIQLGRSQAAKSYVKEKRGITDETIKQFKVGYAPGGGSQLVGFLKKHGFTQQELLDAGLARQRGDNLWDVFRDRVVLPFFDVSGYVIGFTGRALNDSLDKGPKYLNTPQTVLFDKSRFVFGLYQAKESIRTNGEAVIVEGNLDVLSSHQAEVKNVVAVSGTALTTAQIKQLSRLADTITLAFDADSAGVKATERALLLAQEVRTSLYVSSLPNEDDPDDVIRRDPKEWERIIENKVYAVDWLLNVLSLSYDMESAQGKKQLTDRAAEVLQKLNDPVEQEHYVQKVAEMVGVAPSAVIQKLSKLRSQSSKSRKPAPAKQAKPEHDDTDVVANALLCLAAAYPDTRGALKEVVTEHLSPDKQTVVGYLRQNDAPLDTENIPEELQSTVNYVKILMLKGEEEYGSWASLDRQVEAFSLVHRLNKLQTKRYKQHLSQQIAAAEAAGDSGLRQELLKEFNQLN